MKLYLGGKMVGVDGFGHAVFDKRAAVLRGLGHEVFNPAEQDRTDGFVGTGLSGTHDELAAAGFDRRRALRADWAWIGEFSEGMVVIDDEPDVNWRTSPGTISEIGCHQGLYLPVWLYSTFVTAHEWSFTDEALTRLTLPPILELGAAKPQPKLSPVIVRCEKHADVISVDGDLRVCISCDGGVF